jgi:hypothetical protein
MFLCGITLRYVIGTITTYGYRFFHNRAFVINKVLAFNGKIKVVNDGNLKNSCSKKKSQLMYNENQRMCRRDLELKAKACILRC